MWYRVHALHDITIGEYIMRVHYWTVLVTCMACVGRSLSVDILCSDDVCSFLCVCLSFECDHVSVDMAQVIVVPKSER